MSRDRLIVVFARSPHDESRMKPFGPRRRKVEAFHRALLEKTLRAAGAVAPVRLATTGELDSRPGLEVEAQIDGTLGARLSHVMRRAFADGYSQVVLVGSDTPALEPGMLRGAFARLDRGAAVLGPAPDGGFYLLGLDRPSDAAFDDRFLGTAKALSAAREGLRAEGFTVEELEPHADLDSRSDLQKTNLRGELRRLADALFAGTAVFPAIQLPEATTRLDAPLPRGPPAIF